MVTIFSLNSSVIRQKGESESGCFKKTKHAKFSENRTFLTPWYAHVRVRIGVRNARFSENLACFVFLKHPFWDSLFCLITDKLTLYCYHLYFGVIHQSNQVLLNVSDNLLIKVMAGALFHLCSCLVWWTKPKLAWHHNFFDWNVYYFKETSYFVLNNSDFWRTPEDIKCSSFFAGK